MHTKLLTATALAGSLLLLPLIQGPAHSASLASVPTDQNNLTSIAHPGGGGGGGHVEGGGGPGGNGPHAMGGKGPHAMGPLFYEVLLVDDNHITALMRDNARLQLMQ
jgi:hypothetical protein